MIRSLQILIVVAGMLLCNKVSACVVHPKDLGWKEVLQRATGAVIVRPQRMDQSTEIGSPHASFSLVVERSIFDPRGLGRTRTILAKEFTEEVPRKIHRIPEFWAGIATSGSRESDCTFTQWINPNYKYVLLTSVDGPYTLEPITEDDDLWLEVIERWFHEKEADAYALLEAVDVLGAIIAIDTYQCGWLDKSVWETALLGCLLDEERGQVDVTVKLNYGRISLMLDPSTGVLSSESLVRAFGTDFGNSKGISLIGDR